MDMIEEMAAMLRSELPSIAEDERRRIASSVCDPETIRLTKPEFEEAFRTRVIEMTSSTSNIVEVITAHPDILEAAVGSRNEDDFGVQTIADAVREEIADRLIGALWQDAYRLVSDQFGKPDFASMVEEIMATLPKVAAANPDAARVLEEACERQMGLPRATSQILVDPMQAARRALGDQRRRPSREDLVEARKLSELVFLIRTRGPALNKTHVPKLDSKPRP